MPETTTTPTATSPSLWTKIIGEVVLIWGILETTPALKNLPDEWGPWVAGIGALVRIVGEVMQRRGLKLGIENVEAVAGVAADAAEKVNARVATAEANISTVASTTADALDPTLPTSSAESAETLREVVAGTGSGGAAGGPVPGWVEPE